MAPIVTLLTDFGTRDPYVEAMKAAVLSRSREARLIDLTHDIERQTIAPASFWLARVRGYFPAGTVHLAVVDPGVGTMRRPISLSIGDQKFVVPDNGILTDALRHRPENVSAVELDRHQVNPGRRTGTTFDGRDLFAPAAGLLANGAPLAALGPPIDVHSLRRLPAMEGSTVRVIDHYGNLITDAPVPQGNATVRFGDRVIPWAETYGSAGAGELVALRGSWNTVEIAVNRGSAKDDLNAQLGDPVEVTDL